MSSSSNPQELAAIAQRHLVQLLSEEPIDAPWDDRDLSRLLGRRGVPLGPRSVTRYRRNLDIPEAAQRRQWDRMTRQLEMARLSSLVDLDGNQLVQEVAGQETHRLPVVRLPQDETPPPSVRPPAVPLQTPQPFDPDSVFFSSEPDSLDPARQEAMKSFLSPGSTDVLSGDRTLSNIPALLRQLLTPTSQASSPKSPLPEPTPPTQPTSSDPIFDPLPDEALSGWQPFLEFHSDDRAPPPSENLFPHQDEWRELSPDQLRSLEMDTGLMEDRSVLERLFPGPPAEVPVEKPTEGPGSSGMFLFLDEAEDEPDATPPLGTAPFKPAPPRAKGTPIRNRSLALEDTQPERIPGLPDTDPGQEPAFDSPQRAWAELWPFPKYRQLVRDIPLLSNLKLNRSTQLLRPLLASRLREAHRAYLDGQTEEAIEILDSLLAARSNSIRFWAHLLLGELCLGDDDRLPDAQAHLSEAIHMSNRTGRAHLLLAIALYLLDELDQTCALLQHSRNAPSPSPTARLVLGLALLEQGELTRGLAEMEAARKRIEFPQELNERLRHARELLSSGLWSPNRDQAPPQP